MVKMQPGSIMIVGLERTLLLGIFSLFPLLSHTNLHWHSYGTATESLATLPICRSSIPISIMAITWLPGASCSNLSRVSDVTTDGSLSNLYSNSADLTPYWLIGAGECSHTCFTSTSTDATCFSAFVALSSSRARI